MDYSLNSLIIQLSFQNNNKLLIPYEFGIKKSKLINDICNTYKEQINNQINTIKNNIINLTLSLDTTKIYKEPLEYIQYYFDTKQLKKYNIYNNNFEKFLQLFSTICYFEIDDYIQYLRNIILNIISKSTDIEDAKTKLNFSSTFDYKTQSDKLYNDLISYSWTNKNKKRNSIKSSKRCSTQIPNIDIAKSNVFVSKYNNQSKIDLQVPHEINERRRLIEKSNKNLCYECKNPFTTMYREHTCRACGAKIHYSCSESALLKFKPIKPDSGSIISYMKNESIVCKKCKEILNKTGSIYSLWFQFIINIKLPIYYACRLAALTEEWYVAVKSYIITFRSLQHRLPINDYTIDEKNMLWYNRFDFSMHPLWLIQLLKITDFSKIENCYDIYKILTNKKIIKSCEKLCCSKSCEHNGLRPIDCIVILNKHLFKNIPPIIKCLLVSILNNTTMIQNEDDEQLNENELINKELINYLPHLVHYFRFDENPDDLMNDFKYEDINETINNFKEFKILYKNCDNSALIHMIFKRALPNENGWAETSKQLCYELHWLLSVETSNIGMNKNMSYDYSHSGLYNYLKTALIVQLNKTEEGKKMVNSINAQYKMIDILKIKNNEEMITKLEGLLKNKCLFLPCDSSVLVEGIDIDKIKVMNSATRPVVLPFICSYIDPDEDNIEENDEENEKLEDNNNINKHCNKQYNNTDNLTDNLTDNNHYNNQFKDTDTNQDFNQYNNKFNDTDNNQDFNQYNKQFNDIDINQDFNQYNKQFNNTDNNQDFNQYNKQFNDIDINQDFNQYNNQDSNIINLQKIVGKKELELTNINCLNNDYTPKLKSADINNDNSNNDIIVKHKSCKLSEINQIMNNDFNTISTQNNSCKLSEINKFMNNDIINNENNETNNSSDNEYFTDSESETEKFMNISSYTYNTSFNKLGFEENYNKSSNNQCYNQEFKQDFNQISSSSTPSDEQNNLKSTNTSPEISEVEDNTINLLYKPDDIRKDLIILKCKYIIQQILLNIRMRNESISLLPIICYRVQPITKSAGFIELVEGETLEKISDLKNFLLDKAEKNKGINEFIKSVAVSTVLVYIFGIGDRHKENILITEDGLLLDIDFGFLEGKDTICATAYSRIPDEIINFKERQDIFLEWCQCFYLELRRYAIHFHSLFMLLHTSNEDDDMTLKTYDDFIQDRFCINDDELALKKLLDFIDNSRKSSLNNYIRDFTHDKQKSFNNLWNNFSYESIIKWWYNMNKK